MKTFRHLWLVFFIFGTFISYGQIAFTAEVSKKQLGVNERLRVEFKMNKDGDNFNPPSFDEFDIVGGPNQSVKNSWVNGVRSYSKIYTYFLAPKRQGNFTIKQATVEIDGQVYKTTPLSIKVTSAVANSLASPTSNSVEAAVAEKIHLVAEVSKTNPYLNEAITVTYKLYVATDIAISNWVETSIPKYGSFWNQSLDADRKIYDTQYKGQNYRYVVLRKTVLYPQKEGTLKIEPLALRIVAEVPTRQLNIYRSGRLMERVNHDVTAGSHTITVKPLPTEGKPDNFNGAVGDFDFKITASKNELNATESLQAKIEVRGNGNLKLFKLPKLETPSSLEVFEPEHAENVKTNASGMQGSISDTYTIVPQYKGKYPLPKVNFSYFNVKTETYNTISSDELLIDVLEGPSNLNPAVASNASKQPIVQLGGQFNFIKTKSNLSPISEDRFFKSPLFWSLFLMPLLAIPLTVIISRKREASATDIEGNKRRKANKLAKKYLSDSKKALGNKDAFYVALEKALHNYLKAKLRIETSEVSKEHIGELLVKREVDNDTIKDFKNLLANCELARYSPFTDVAMKEDYEKASETISKIDKQLA